MRYHRPAHLKRHQEVHVDNPNKPRARKGRAAANHAGAAPGAAGPNSGGGAGRKRKIATELENEIDELAGDGDGPRIEDSNGSSVGTRERPKRAAAIAAVAATRKRWDQDLDLGDEEGEEEDDDDEDEEDAASKMQEDDGDEDDEDDEEEEDNFNHKGKRGRRINGGSSSGNQGRPPIISSSGGPQYGTNGVSTPFSNTRATYGMMLVDASGKGVGPAQHPGSMGMQIHPAMLVHGVRQDEEMDGASPGVAPAAEGNEDGDDDD